MAGTIPLSMTQQFNEFGEPLNGGLLYIIQVGTVSTPQNAYQDTGLTIPLSYPIVLDAAGRVPQFFLADGSVKIRLQDRFGVVQLASDSVLVIGASSGGGGGATVDPTALIQTGDMVFAHSTAVRTGFVKLNGLSIGSATSAATQRQHADTQALFLFLWPDTNLTIWLGGGLTTRGASAAADWAAFKHIAVPDWRGYSPGGLDDMGATAAGRYGLFFTTPTVLGAVGGSASVALGITHIPAHTHGGTTGGSDRSLEHNHSYTSGTLNGITYAPNAGAFQGSGATGLQTGGVANGGTNSIDHLHAFSTTTTPGANGTTFGAFGPRKLVTFYMKL